MKVMVLKSFGGPESFELCDVPNPKPDAGQVLVRVEIQSALFSQSTFRPLACRGMRLRVPGGQRAGLLQACLMPSDLIRELSVVGFSPSNAAAPFAP